MNVSQDKWSTIPQVKSFLEKKWSSGLFLRDVLDPSDIFPLKVPLRGPGSKELSLQYDRARVWVQQFLCEDKRQLFRVEWQQINNRVLGNNQLPVAICFDNRENLFRFIGKSNDFKLFAQSAQNLLSAFPELKNWVIHYPFTLLEYTQDLKKLISIAQWMIKNPQPRIYLRQLSLEEIDTKFIETHKRVLSEWFDILLDSSNLDSTSTGIKGFERRYGFLEKPPQIRFRILDNEKRIHGLTDLVVRADEFCSLNLNITTVFVTENDINGLAFPMIEESIVLFGRGYGFEYLQNAYWLKNKELWYWGDIDTHGFAILNQFRIVFPSVKSFLMDRDTLFIHKKWCVKENISSDATLENLTEEEQALYNDLRKNTFGESIRLEQEFIPFEYLNRYLVEIGKL